MNNVLENRASALGTYDHVPAEILSNIVTTDMVSGLVITKQADKTVWTDGHLTYTVTIKNNAIEEYANVVLTDVLDPTKVELVEFSVKVDGTSHLYAYDEITGALTVVLSTLLVGEEVEITFQVQKKI